MLAATCAGSVARLSMLQILCQSRMWGVVYAASREVAMRKLVCTSAYIDDGADVLAVATLSSCSTLQPTSVVAVQVWLRVPRGAEVAGHQ